MISTAAPRNWTFPLGSSPIANPHLSREPARAGNRTVIIDARGNRITFTYDSRGSQTELVDQLARRTTFGYDELRRQSWRWDPKNQRVTHAYDAAGRLSHRDYSDGSIATFSYDAVGNRLTMADGTGVTTYSHNPANALEAVTYPGAKIITYAYDGVGNRATMNDPDGGLTTYSYDAANRIGALLNPFAERTTFVHDVTGKPITQLNANGTWVSYSYDDAGRLTVLANLKSDNTTISSFLYSLDNVGNRTAVQEAGGDLVTWSYDDTYQLTREQRSGANAYDITYSYDPVGNRLTKLEGGATTTYSYDAANQIETEETPSQITTFTFDANGNTQVENAGGSLTTYTWNVDNMCVGIALPSGGLNTFAYDGDLKRRQAQDSAGLAKFINDLDKVLAETDSGGTTQVAYAYEPVQYGNLISQRRSGATAWHLFDALGSTERLTGSDQAALATYLNTAFGVPKVATGNHPNRLRWVGRQGYRWEPDVTQYDLRRRRMKSARGCFLSRDPADPRATHMYSYAKARPTHLTDPSGLKCDVSTMWWDVNIVDQDEYRVDPNTEMPSAVGLVCAAYLQAAFLLLWHITPDSDSSDCAVLQWYSNLCTGFPWGDYFVPWRPDDGLGWPPPYDVAWTCSDRLCLFGDRPNQPTWEMLPGEGPPVSPERRIRMQCHVRFLTCICGRNPSAGPFCVYWSIGSWEPDVNTCRAWKSNTWAWPATPQSRNALGLFLTKWNAPGFARNECGNWQTGKLGSRPGHRPRQGRCDQP